MLQNIVKRFALHNRGNINYRAEDAEDKGSLHIIAGPHALRNFERSGNRLTKPDITYQRVSKEKNNTRNPHYRKRRHNNLQRIHAVTRSGGEAVSDNGVDGCVNCRDTNLTGRPLRHYNIYRNRFFAGYKAQHTFKSEWAYQPYSHNSPKKTCNPLRGFFKNEPQNNGRKNQPTGGDAHIDYLKKNSAHFLSPFLNASIIF